MLRVDFRGAYSNGQFEYSESGHSLGTQLVAAETQYISAAASNVRTEEVHLNLRSKWENHPSRSLSDPLG